MFSLCPLCLCGSTILNGESGARQHDAVALDVLADEPAETQVGPLGVRRLPLADELAVLEIVAAPVPFLHQQSAIDSAIIEDNVLPALREWADAQQADVLLPA